MSYRCKDEWEEYLEQEIDERGLTLDLEEREKLVWLESHKEVEKYLDELAVERERETEYNVGIDKVD